MNGELRQEIVVLQNAIAARKSSFTVKKGSVVWQRIFDKHGIGQKVGNKITFTKADIESLRGIYERQLDTNLLSIDLSGSRQELAEQNLDEKLSNRPVFENLVWLGGFLPIHLKNGVLTAPPNTLVAVRQEDILLESVSHLVLIENGTSIVNWSDIKLPKHFDHPIFVYRGHTSSQNYVRSLFDRAACQKVGFVDVDPAGVDICNTKIPCNSMLLPNEWSTILKLDNRALLPFKNKKETFLDQATEFEKYRSTLDGKAEQLFKFLLDNKVSIMQEHIVASGYDLVEYVF